MKKLPTFEWDDDANTMHCWLLDDNNHLHYGCATCHPDDIDMVSEKTGGEIAFRRAKIASLRHRRNYDLKPRLAALNQLYYSMKHSSKFNEKSYENIMLQRQIRLTKFELTTINENIAYESKNLKDLIDKKDKLYKQIRINRKGQN